LYGYKATGLQYPGFLANEQVILITIPPNMVGNIYDEQTRQVVRRLFARLTETQLWALKRLIVSDAIPNLPEDR
jgi:hypothetical protein